MGVLTAGQIFGEEEAYNYFKEDKKKEKMEMKNIKKLLEGQNLLEKKVKIHNKKIEEIFFNEQKLLKNKIITAPYECVNYFQ